MPYRCTTAPPRKISTIPESVVMLCGWAVKAGMAHSICGCMCGWQAKLSDTSLIYARSEHFRGESHSSVKHYTHVQFIDTLTLTPVTKDNQLDLTGYLCEQEGAWVGGLYVWVSNTYRLQITAPLHIRISSTVFNTTTATVTLRPLYRSTCISQPPRLKTGGFCWRKD